MPTPKHHNVSYDSEYGEEGKESSRGHTTNDDEMFNAIVASLIDYTGNGVDQEAARRNALEEERILKEIMHLSKMEDDKKNGKLNLDGLKRKNKANKAQK